ncbi:MAG TPA: nucleotide exchange factor GrpE [Kofleriaceae bacterium]|jgi:molecular chaperone GrpE|nr:nucleotide exchange factor GrpE [Kofleriaceae bacterium]
MSEADENASDQGNGEAPINVEVDASDLPADPSAARIAELEAQLAAAEKDKKDNWDKYLRTAADLENYRKRTKRDIDDAKADTKSRVLKEILPVVDNLERAMAHETDGSAVLEGIKLVHRQFLTALERLEVTAVEAMGQPFDPNLHEAIGQEESDSPPGSVVKVLQTGYKLGDRLLRPALVVVAKPKTTSAEPS